MTFLWFSFIIRWNDCHTLNIANQMIIIHIGFIVWRRFFFLETLEKNPLPELLWLLIRFESPWISIDILWMKNNWFTYTEKPSSDLIQFCCLAMLYHWTIFYTVSLYNQVCLSLPSHLLSFSFDWKRSWPSKRRRSYSNVYHKRSYPLIIIWPFNHFLIRFNSMVMSLLIYRFGMDCNRIDENMRFC